MHDCRPFFAPHAMEEREIFANYSFPHEIVPLLDLSLIFAVMRPCALRSLAINEFILKFAKCDKLVFKRSLCAHNQRAIASNLHMK